MKLIPLTRGYSAMVDDEDFERVSQFKWTCNKKEKIMYAKRNARDESGRIFLLSMHRFLLGLTDRKVYVDHINQDGLDNRRENLRVCNASQNMRNVGVRSNNTSGFKGVSWNGSLNKFGAQIKKGGLTLNLGYFDCPKEAARHYNKAATEHGEGFELLNDVEPLFPMM